MAIVRYCILNSSTNVCTQIFDWDDTYTYYPASGTIVAGDNTGQVGWTYSSGSSPGGTWTEATGSTGGSYVAPDPIAITEGGTGASTAATARTNLGLGTGDSPQFTAIELGNASDTTIAREKAGVISVEGNYVPSPASQAHGDILYRDAGNWAVLAAGTSGQFLKTQGSGAAPTWANAGGITLLGTITTTTGSEQGLTGLTLTNYKALFIVFIGVSHNSGSSQSFRIHQAAGTSTVQVGAAGSSATVRGIIWVDLNDGTFSSVLADSGTSASGTSTAYAGDTTITTASTAVYVSVSGGGFDAGSVRVYGVM